MALMLEKRSHIDGATFIYFHFLIYKNECFCWVHTICNQYDIVIEIIFY